MPKNVATNGAGRRELFQSKLVKVLSSVAIAPIY
jgi:hypothetical protein